jgi:hypothetical protein
MCVDDVRRDGAQAPAVGELQNTRAEPFALAGRQRLRVVDASQQIGRDQRRHGQHHSGGDNRPSPAAAPNLVEAGDPAVARVPQLQFFGNSRRHMRLKIEDRGSKIE